MIEESITSGDFVVNRWTGRATHIGTFWGVAPTGRLVTWSGVTIYCLLAGKITEIWIHADALSLRQQLKGGRTPGRNSM